MSDTKDSADKQRITSDGVVDKREKVPRASDTGTGSGSVGSVLAILLALVALGVASYPAYEIYRQQSAPAADDIVEQQLPTEISNLRASIAALETGAAAFSEQAAALSEQATALSEQLAASEAADKEAQQQTAAALDSLRSRIGTSSHDWVYAELEYLIRMANQRLLMEQDPTSALRLLQSADGIIEETDGLAAHELREAIQNDIASLKAVAKIDTQGIYLTLSALVQQVPQLPRNLPVFEAAPTQSPEADSQTGFVERVMSAASRASHRFFSLVDFRRGTVEIKRILPPEEDYYLRQNLILKLQVAQMALLDGNDAIYQDALTNARQWVIDSFDQDTAATQAMSSALEQLAAQQISVVLPDISGSLNAARKKLSGFKEVGPK